MHDKSAMWHDKYKGELEILPSQNFQPGRKDRSHSHSYKIRKVTHSGLREARQIDIQYLTVEEFKGGRWNFHEGVHKRLEINWKMTFR